MVFSGSVESNRGVSFTLDHPLSMYPLDLGSSLFSLIRVVFFNENEGLVVGIQPTSVTSCGLIQGVEGR